MVTMLADPPTLKRKVTGLWRTEAIPPELVWIERLSPLNFRMFIAEIHDAVGTACIDDDWERVAELLENWAATAEVDADEELSKYLLSKPEGKDYQEVSA